MSVLIYLVFPTPEEYIPGRSTPGVYLLPSYPLGVYPGCHVPVYRHLALWRNPGAGKMVAVSCVALTVCSRKWVIFVRGRLLQQPATTTSY
jgi:hypothetical protein